MKQKDFVSSCFVYKKIYWIIFLLLIFSGCALKVPIEPVPVKQFSISQKIPLTVGILVVRNENYNFKGHPESYTASLRSHKFPLGKMLEILSVKMFSQIFTDVQVVNDESLLKNYDICIRFIITEFHFRYDALRYAGFAMSVVCKISIHAIVEIEKNVILNEVITSPEIREGPWVIDWHPERRLSKCAQRAIMFVLDELAQKLYYKI